MLSWNLSPRERISTTSGTSADRRVVRPDRGRVSTRTASALTGVVRSTAGRRRAAATVPTPPVVAAAEPTNKLTDIERRHILDVLDSDRFVDQAPLEIYAQLLDEGNYLCSVSTMYRVLRDNAQVRERHRLEKHPKKTCPELVATALRVRVS